MNYRLFSMRSNKLISDFDFVPEKMPEQQEGICEDCRYRWYRIDMDIARACKKPLPSLDSVTPACEREKCLIDEEITRLLNKETLTKSEKEAGR